METSSDLELLHTIRRTDLSMLTDCHMQPHLNVLHTRRPPEHLASTMKQPLPQDFIIPDPTMRTRPRIFSSRRALCFSNLALCRRFLRAWNPRPI